MARIGKEDGIIVGPADPKTGRPIKYASALGTAEPSPETPPCPVPFGSVGGTRLSVRAVSRPDTVEFYVES